jgi:hypothetical protein
MVAMNTYLFKIHSDNGTVSLYVNARNEEIAKFVAMDHEKCPERAIFSIRKLKLRICL